MHIKRIVLAIGLMVSSGISYADGWFDWAEGVKASACATLPTGTCELLSKENHKNMINAIAVFKLQSVCESINIDFIETEIENNRAIKPCKDLYAELKNAGVI